MHPAPLNFYDRWQRQRQAGAVLQESADEPPETLLQAIWQQQRLRRDQLSTLDAQPVRVLHPGFASVEGGPDFQGAIIQFGSAEPVAGDVEIDVRKTGWRAHGHDKNPAFRKVILHVVWEARGAAADCPTLALTPQLDAPVSELRQQLGTISLRRLPKTLQGRCCTTFRELPEAGRQALLQEAATVRLYGKAHHFRIRAQHAGWEQALWEGLFRALGYKHNSWPMQCLAETRSRWMDGARSVVQLQARLLGISGLLPAELNGAQPETGAYLRRIWDIWWREREEFSDCLLPRTLWRFHGLRPANHPQRRLALAAHWLHRPDFVAAIGRWCDNRIPDNKLAAALGQILEVSDDFWSRHWTLRSRPKADLQPLIGAQRGTDLAGNVILPWLLARALAGRNTELVQEIERRYQIWPAAADNSVLRLARQRLLGQSLGKSAGFKTLAGQQGLLQIVRDFCQHSNALCEGCRFPELVQQWQRDQGTRQG